MHHAGWAQQFEAKDNGWPSTPISPTMSNGVGFRTDIGIWEATPATPIFLSPPTSAGQTPLLDKTRSQGLYVNSMHPPLVQSMNQIPHAQRPLQSLFYEQREQLLHQNAEPDRARVQTEAEPLQAHYGGHSAGSMQRPALSSRPPAGQSSGPREPSPPSCAPRSADQASAAASVPGGRPPLPRSDGSPAQPPLDPGPAERQKDYFEILGVERDCSGRRPLPRAPQQHSGLAAPPGAGPWAARRTGGPGGVGAARA